MPIKKVSFFLLLLIYLSGTFTLDRLNFGIRLEVRHLLMIIFWLVLLVGISLSKRERTDKRLKSRLPLIMLLFAYVFSSLISLFYAPDFFAAAEKFQTTLFLLILVVTTIMVVTTTTPMQFYSWISNFFMGIGLVYAIPVLIDVVTGASRGDVGLSGPNVATRIFFFALCSSLFSFSVKKKNSYILLGILFASSIIMVGSRGGLIGASISLLAMFFIRVFSKPWKFKKGITFTPRHLSLLLLALFSLYHIYEPVKRVVVERIIGLTFQRSGVYTSGRDLIYSAAIRMIKDSPIIGHGLQAFTYKTGFVYPHNLLLEMTLEIGVVGILIFIGFTTIALRVLITFRKRPFFIFAGIPLYMIFVQMFSGEFYDFRYYFLWVIPLLTFGVVSEDELMLDVGKKRQRLAVI